MTKIISGQAQNDTWKDNFGRDITPWQLNRETHAARRQLRSWTDESAGWSSGRHARGPDSVFVSPITSSQVGFVVVVESARGRARFTGTKYATRIN